MPVTFDPNPLRIPAGRRGATVTVTITNHALNAKEESQGLILVQLIEPGLLEDTILDQKSTKFTPAGASPGEVVEVEPVSFRLRCEDGKVRGDMAIGSSGTITLGVQYASGGDNDEVLNTDPTTGARVDATAQCV